MINKNEYIKKLKLKCSFDNQCWTWRGETKKINGKVYGYFNNVPVHELMWMLENPESKSGQFDKENYFINHKCKNRLCINPKHMYLEANLNSRSAKRIQKKVLGEKFFDPLNWDLPKNPEPKPSSFADWIFSCEVGKTESTPWFIRENFKKRGKINRIKLENILSKKWFIKDHLNENEKWELYYSDLKDSEHTFKASKLQLNNIPFFCKPDVILFEKSNNKFIIIERKFTFVPLERILIPKWSSAQAQLWCYSWIDDLVAAKNVTLILELYKPLTTDFQNDDFLLPLNHIFTWYRNDQIHHQKCLKMFNRYGGSFAN